jgi:hypothetical protein
MMDWVNEPVWRKVRRIDIVLAIAGIVCVGYYGAVAGWLGALQGGLLFVLMVMIGLWLL